MLQSILLLALDRFADYQGERSNIMVRAVGAKVLLNIFDSVDCDQKRQILNLIRDLLSHRSEVADGLAPFAWELRHSFVYWIYLLLEIPEYRQQAFEVFRGTFLELMDRSDEDEVILTLCECLNLLYQEPFFTLDYAKQVNTKLWDLIDNLDDVSYSATKIFTFLTNYLSLVELGELECLLRLKKFFTSRIEGVRKEFYKLETHIFDRSFSIKTAQNYRLLDKPPTLTNIVPWTAIQFLQEIMVEECS